MNTIREKGFTLLELLIVMALIGVLAAISLAYMSRSKDSGGDAGVRQNLINARSQAEVYHANNNGSYEGVCTTSGSLSIGRHVRAAQRAYGGTPKASYADGTASTWNTEECHDSTDGYAVWVPLRASTNGSPLGLCIDGENTTKEATVVLGAGIYTCP